MKQIWNWFFNIKKKPKLRDGVYVNGVKIYNATSIEDLTFTIEISGKIKKFKITEKIQCQEL